jgi:hypothetical protein
MAFCQSKGGIPYFETSAKEAMNVEQAFEGTRSSFHQTSRLQLQSLQDRRWYRRKLVILTQIFQKLSPSDQKAQMAAAHVDYSILLSLRPNLCSFLSRP